MKDSVSVQVEGLRLWRVCALHDIPIASLDALWPLLAAHFAGPPVAAAGDASPAADAATAAADERTQSASSAATAGDGNGDGNGDGVLQGGATQCALAREALLTAAELVCHAAR